MIENTSIPSFSQETISPLFEDVLKVVRRAKMRWRLRVGVIGAAIVVAAGFLAFFLSVWGMDYFLYSDRAVTWLRLLTWLSLTALAVRFLVLPLSQRVSDERVALYIEEHEPSLQAGLLSALEVGHGRGDEAKEGSSALTRQLMMDVIESCRDINYGNNIEEGKLRRGVAALAAAAAIAAFAIFLSPAFLQRGAMLLFTPWKTAAMDNPYTVDVAPGNTRVAKGADLQVFARLVDFNQERVDLLVRSGEEDWTRVEMLSVQEIDEVAAMEAGLTPDEVVAFHEGFDHMLLNLEESTEYFVEAASIRSPVYTIDVVDLPWVEQIDLEYRFPAYTGLSPRQEEDGGDIVALRGTEVGFRIKTTLPVTAGRIVIDEQDEVLLVVDEEGVLTADLEITKSGFYRVELPGFSGDLERASSEYGIQVIADQSPSLRFKTPGRDIEAHKIDEVFLEVEAEDDFGISQIEMMFSVNGGEETVQSLYSGSRKKASGSHTFYLEELPLEPGDFISYYARAFDKAGVGGRQKATSDIYFIEIRPFGKDYSKQDGGGGGGGGGDQGLDNSLSLTQRQIVAATFRLIRDRSEYSDKEYSENLATLALMQGRLREQADTLIRRMQNRATLLSSDDFQKIIGFLTAAGEQMTLAEEQLLAREAEKAMPFEQKALSELQRAEAVFRDVRVSFDPSGGGGGGGEPQQLSEDLADLFELELDKLRNQYETVKRGERQETEQEIDEALQRLKELARRQQQENERARKRGLPGSPGGSGKNQQELVEETEELARKLEKLAREQSRPELQESARQLREAANDMRRAAANRSDQSLGQGISALDELRDAKRLLDKSRRRKMSDEMSEVGEQAQRIKEMQERISEQVKGLPTQQEAAQSAEASEQQREQMSRLFDRKDQLRQEIEDLESELDRIARQSRQENGDASRSLQDAANSIRNNQLSEKVEYSKGVARGRERDFANRFEEEIKKDINELAGQIGEAQEAMDGSQSGNEAEALDRARELVQSLESLEGRLRDKTSKKGDQGQQQGEGQQGESQQGESQQGQQADGERGEGQGQGSKGQEGKEGQQAGEGSKPGQEGQPGQQAQTGEGQSGEGQSPGEGSEPGQGEGQAESQQAGNSSGQQTGQGGSGPFSQIGSNTGNSFQPGTMNSDEIRQFQRELQERSRETRDLRDDLKSQGLQVADLDQILRQMDELKIRKLNNDPLALDQLREDIVEGFRQFEFGLWRQLQGDEEKLFLSNSDHVPEGYRDLVEQYYRELARKP